MSTFKDGITVSEEQNGERTVQTEEKPLEDTGGVHERYRGTAHDKREMSVMGKQQVLRVSRAIIYCVFLLIRAAQLQIRDDGRVCEYRYGELGNIAAVRANRTARPSFATNADPFTLDFLLLS